MPVDRSWTVPEDPQHLPDLTYTQDGDLLVQPRVVRDGDDSTLEAILEALAILRRVGGTIQIASQRGEIAPEVVVTESYIFAYNSFTPLIRRLGDDLQPAFDQGAGDDEPLAHEASGDISADDLAHHFPGMTEGQIGEAIAKANTEVPAEPEPAAAVE